MIGTALLTGLVVAGGGMILCRWLRFQSERTPFNAPARVASRSDRFDGPTVVCIGDSITQGRTSSDYVAMLQERFHPKGYRFVNAGVDGDLAYNVLQRLDAVVACRPAYITLMVGTNDVHAALSTASAHETKELRGLPERPTRETFRRHLTEICLRLRTATAARLALMSLPPLGEDPRHHAFEMTAVYSRIIRNVACETGSVYLPIHESMRAYLEGRPQTPGRSFGDYRNGMGMAARIRRFLLRQSFDAISRRNGLCLLTDFFHLNDTAGAMVADAVAAFLTGPHDAIVPTRCRGL